MADTINTKRNYRAEARPVFEDMGRVLECIRDDGLDRDALIKAIDGHGLALAGLVMRFHRIDDEIGQTGQSAGYVRSGSESVVTARGSISAQAGESVRALSELFHSVGVTENAKASTRNVAPYGWK